MSNYLNGTGLSQVEQWRCNRYLHTYNYSTPSVSYSSNSSSATSITVDVYIWRPTNADIQASVTFSSPCSVPVILEFQNNEGVGAFRRACMMPGQTYIETVAETYTGNNLDDTTHVIVVNSSDLSGLYSFTINKTTNLNVQYLHKIYLIDAFWDMHTNTVSGTIRRKRDGGSTNLAITIPAGELIWQRSDGAYLSSSQAITIPTTSANDTYYSYSSVPLGDLWTENWDWDTGGTIAPGEYGGNILSANFSNGSTTYTYGNNINKIQLAQPWAGRTGTNNNLIQINITGWRSLSGSQILWNVITGEEKFKPSGSSTWEPTSNGTITSSKWPAFNYTTSNTVLGDRWNVELYCVFYYSDTDLNVDNEIGHIRFTGATVQHGGTSTNFTEISGGRTASIWDSWTWKAVSISLRLINPSTNDIEFSATGRTGYLSNTSWSDFVEYYTNSAGIFYNVTTTHWE